MTLLAVVALTDAQRVVAPHVRHHVASLVEAGADVVLAGRTALDPSHLLPLGDHVRAAVCPGAGGALSLLGHAVRAAHVDGASTQGDVVLCTDRVVGPFVDLATALPATSGRTVRVVLAPRPGPAAGDAVEVLRLPARALHDPVVAALLLGPGGRAAPARWSDLGTVLAAAGFEVVPVYRPTAGDLLRSRARLLRHLSSAPGGVQSTRALLRHVRTADLREGREVVDAAFDGRLPYLALDALRAPPPGGRADLLTVLERRYPAALAGVREVLGLPVTAGRDQAA